MPGELDADRHDGWNASINNINLEKIISIVKGYWFHAGKWHKAECDFILHDEGVCNCSLKSNK